MARQENLGRICKSQLQGRIVSVKLISTLLRILLAGNSSYMIGIIDMTDINILFILYLCLPPQANCTPSTVMPGRKTCSNSSRK